MANHWLVRHQRIALRSVLLAAVLGTMLMPVGLFNGAAWALPPPGGTITLIGQLNMPEQNTVSNSDIWGWVDPNTGKEYVAIGQYPSQNRKIYLVDVSNPASPFLANTLTGVPSFDMKIFQQGTSTYLYACDGNSTGVDSEIWNVTNPLAPVFEGFFASCHNIFIDPLGFMYLAYFTTRIYDLNPDPTNPMLKWGDAITSGGHDVTVIGNRMYDFHGYDGTYIYDVTDRSAPVVLGTIPSGSGIVYNHSGWPSATGRFLFINDELGPSTTADITAWDISNPAAPFKVSEYIDPNATVHNSFRVGDFLFTSFYVAGFRVFDISAPWSFFLSDEYDTSPSYTGNGNYAGCWGAYTGSPTGNIMTSDMQNGLFIFSFTGPVVTGITGDTPQTTSFALNQNFPNPFNPSTTISYDLRRASRVTLTVFNASGGKVKRLVDSYQTAGPQSVIWSGENQMGQPVASGVYFYTLQVDGGSSTKRMILLK